MFQEGCTALHFYLCNFLPRESLLAGLRSGLLKASVHRLGVVASHFDATWHAWPVFQQGCSALHFHLSNFPPRESLLTGSRSGDLKAIVHSLGVIAYHFEANWHALQAFKQGCTALHFYLCNFLPRESLLAGFRSGVLKASVHRLGVVASHFDATWHVWPVF
jgi:hypothetical protein